MIDENAWQFSDRDFDSIAKIAKGYFGLNLSRSKTALIQSRLSQRMRHLGLSKFSDYLQRLDGPTAKDERTQLLSVLTTNVTHFFREDHHFTALRENVLPPLLKAAAAGARIRIWSAGCSTGPEPYSLAMTLLDMCPKVSQWNVKILATDIDPVVIETAKVGSFEASDVDALPEKFLQKYLRPDPADPNRRLIEKKVRDLITFGVLNLIEPLPFKGPFDVIFCRNVAIYFDRETQIDLWATFSNVMMPGSHLCIGHSEHLLGSAKANFNKIGFTMYQRI